MESISKNRLGEIFIWLSFILFLIVLGEAVSLVWLWKRAEPTNKPDRGGFIAQANSSNNPVKALYHDVDFTKIYPDLTDREIDQVQRECLSIRYLYSPFIEFEPMPVSKRFVVIEKGGFRKGHRNQPWPPKKEDFVVFVFGGSTAFGFGVPNEQTVASHLEQEMGILMPDRNIQCYNFGRGYYFSTQERLLFEKLLLEGNVPDVAVFIDGLNDFLYVDGRPELTPILYGYLAPDLPPPPQISISSDDERIRVVDRIIERYRGNVGMVEAIAARFQVCVLFVGQPVPFLHLRRNPNTYPFRVTIGGFKLCEWGYAKFGEAGLRGDFGKNFLWCGEAFSESNAIMYADSIHYSYEGSKTLARSIVETARSKNLLCLHGIWQGQKGPLAGERQHFPR